MNLIILLFFLPILASAISLFAPPKRVFLPALLSVLSCLLVLFFTNRSASWVWFSVADLDLSVNMHIDVISLKILYLVQIVGLLVIVFSVFYIGDSQNRYFAFLSLFLGAMNGLLVFKNLLLLYVFWEWMGVCSFWLIGFWFRDKLAGDAAQKAFLINRVGDVCVLSGIILAYIHTNSWDYPQAGVDSVWWAWFIVMGTVAKSAQLPLSIWLPDAMKGPTPVSALIHAATMVAAGVYLAIRVSPWLGESLVLAYLGLFTALLAALTAVFQTDIKKLLAYSTISQLGLMVFAVGFLANEAALAHLLAHGLFKAGLFLAAGCFIFALHHLSDQQAQDIDNISKIASHYPWIRLSFSVCALSLAGVPLTSGFFSKEMIVEAAAKDFFTLGLLFLVSCLTAFYSFRIIFKLWSNNKQVNIITSNLSLNWMGVIVAILAFLSVGWWNLNLEIHLISFIVSILSLLFGMAFAYRFRNTFLDIGLLKEFFYFNNSYKYTSRYFVKTAEIFSYTDKRILDRAINLFAQIHYVIAHIAIFFDKNLIDGMIRQTCNQIRNIGHLTFSFQDKKLQQYLINMAILIVMVIFYLIIN